MRYIIFGAGHTGVAAMWFLNPLRVAFFASNDSEQKIVHGKVVLSYADMEEKMRTGKYILVIASDLYWQEMEEQVKKSKITRYLIYHESDTQNIIPVWPGYLLRCQYRLLTYVEIVNFWQLHRYKKIAVYGDNSFLPYLLSEIAIQAGIDNIAGVIKTSGDEVSLLGLPLIDMDDCWEDIDCLIVNRRRNEDAVFDTLRKRKHDFAVFYMYEDGHSMEQSFYHPELMRYKDIHKGKRCFLLGNGPSLTVEDLDKLAQFHEITFGCNRIYRVYDRTKWRADYLCFSDPEVLDLLWNDLPDVPGEKFFTDLLYNEWNPDFFDSSLNFVHQNTIHYYPQMPAFSMNICRCTYWGQSVIYDLALPVAIFMGFEEIYLLGNDCLWQGTTSMDKRDHFLENYYDDNERGVFKQNMVVPEKSFVAYESAKLYAEEHGIKIYNATRGGALEVFERVEFDSLFPRAK